MFGTGAEPLNPIHCFFGTGSVDFLGLYKVLPGESACCPLVQPRVLEFVLAELVQLPFLILSPEKSWKYWMMVQTFSAHVGDSSITSGHQRIDSHHKWI
jgi:hypothetical protein